MIPLQAKTQISLPLGGRWHDEVVTEGVIYPIWLISFCSRDKIRFSSLEI